MVKEAEIRDLIHGDVNGALIRWEQAIGNRYYPVIRPQATTLREMLFPFTLREKKIKKYKLKINGQEKDIEETQSGDHKTIFLIPNSDIPGINENDTIFAQMKSSAADNIKKKNERIEDLKKELNATKKELEKYQDEEEERKKSKRNDKGAEMVCNDCGATFSKKEYMESSNECPNCMSQNVSMDYL